MKYDQIILESLQKVSLQRVRIKVDPVNVAINKDLSVCDGYEGYVLAEGETSMRILVINPDLDSTSVMDIPNEYLQKLQSVSQNLENLKVFILTALNASEDDPIVQNIQSSESIDDVESFLRDRGLTEDEITKLYKYYIANE
jgi:hypothetical protein